MAHGRLGSVLSPQDGRSPGDDSRPTAGILATLGTAAGELLWLYFGGPL